MSIFKNIFNLIVGDENKKHIKKYQEKVREINALESKFATFTDKQLREQTDIFKRQILSVRKDDSSDEDNYKAENDVLSKILPEAFAVVREASKRVLGMRHFDVQLIGGIALHDGNIAEMSTGEGKTFVETLPTYLNALTYSDHTVYPVSSNNEASFINLTNVYLDSVFNPLVTEVPEIFYQEGMLGI